MSLDFIYNGSMTSTGEEVLRIVESLRHYGVGVLVCESGDAPPPVPVELSELVIRMTTSREPRVRDALICLFLMRPETATLVASICQRVDPEVARLIQIRYTAAAALERLWRSRLRRVSLMPDLCSAELGVSNVDTEHGRAALRELAEKERALRIERHAESVYRSAVEHCVALQSSRENAGDHAFSS